jgi:alpha-glucosidase
LHIKKTFIITRSAYAEHSVIRLLGRVIMLPLDIYVANIQVQRMSISEWALLVLISADSRSNHLELYTRWIQLGVFHPFAEHIPPGKPRTMGI